MKLNSKLNQYNKYMFSLIYKYMELVLSIKKFSTLEILTESVTVIILFNWFINQLFNIYN